MLNDYGYIDKAIANIREVAEKQEANIKAAAKLMADAIADDKLINVYAGGGHTTLAMGEMFFEHTGMGSLQSLHILIRHRSDTTHALHDVQHQTLCLQQ